MKSSIENNQSYSFLDKRKQSQNQALGMKYNSRSFKNAKSLRQSTTANGQITNQHTLTVRNDALTFDNRVKRDHSEIGRQMDKPDFSENEIKIK